MAWRRRGPMCSYSKLAATMRRVVFQNPSSNIQVGCFGAAVWNLATMVAWVFYAPNAWAARPLSIRLFWIALTTTPWMIGKTDQAWTILTRRLCSHFMKKLKTLCPCKPLKKNTSVKIRATLSKPLSAMATSGRPFVVAKVIALWKKALIVLCAWAVANGTRSKAPLSPASSPV